MKKIIASALVVLCFGCKPNKTEKEVKTIVKEEVSIPENTNPFVASIEKSHQKKAFLNHKAISYTLDITFGGHKHLEGTITQLTDGSKIKIEKKDGSTIVFDGENVYANNVANDKAKAGARFDIFTWSYFLGLPYKLADEGTIWSTPTTKKWGDTYYNTSRLTFEAGTGDAPKDWYVIYQNPENKILEGAAYIVSFGKSIEDAEKEPHAIKFNKFENVNGIPFANHWTFHMWSDAEGYGKQIGNVDVSNIHFKEEASFIKTDDAIEINTL